MLCILRTDARCRWFGADAVRFFRWSAGDTKVVEEKDAGQEVKKKKKKKDDGKDGEKKKRKKDADGEPKKKKKKGKKDARVRPKHEGLQHNEYSTPNQRVGMLQQQRRPVRTAALLAALVCVAVLKCGCAPAGHAVVGV